MKLGLRTVRITILTNPEKSVIEPNLVKIC